MEEEKKTSCQEGKEPLSHQPPSQQLAMVDIEIDEELEGNESDVSEFGENKMQDMMKDGQQSQNFFIFEQQGIIKQSPEHGGMMFAVPDVVEMPDDNEDSDDQIQLKEFNMTNQEEDEDDHHEYKVYLNSEELGDGSKNAAD